jgi:hypothetical protein
MENYKKKPSGVDWPYPIPPLNYDHLSRVINEANQIGSVRREAELLIEDFIFFIEDCSSFGLQLRYIKRILYILMVSIPLFVAYPMHFLPLPINTEPRVLFSLSNMANLFPALRVFFYSPCF